MLVFAPSFYNLHSLLSFVSIQELNYIVKILWKITAASIFAIDYKFGSLSIDMTDNKIASIPRIGRHLYSAF